MAICMTSHSALEIFHGLRIAQSDELLYKRSRSHRYQRKITMSRVRLGFRFYDRISSWSFDFFSFFKNSDLPDLTSTSIDGISAMASLLRDSPKVSQSTTAPLVEAVKSSANEDVACFHFPGHNRGKAAPFSLSQLTSLKPFAHDLPALSELDEFCSPKGVILDAQKQASELFGASKTWFLVNGTTCGIHASIMSTCSPGETLILPRNSHISAISGLILSGAVPKYIIPEYSNEWDIAGGITSSQVENALNDLESAGKKAAAVLVTSPTYHGICSNLRGITQLCHCRGIPVIVDEAHGAHFRFHNELPSTAIEQGADLAVQSTHKVLTSLTQSSMLHLSRDLIDKERVSKCLQMLQSSSPSYLLLASLDAARAQLSENPDTIFNEAMDIAVEARHRISTIPGISLLDLPSFVYSFPSIDPFRVTIGVSKLGISGYMAADVLCHERKVICELAGSRSVTFALNLGTCREDVHRLVSGIEYLSMIYQQGNEIGSNIREGVYAPFKNIALGLSPREAFFARKKKVAIEDCRGERCGELIFSYPPGIPVLSPGEIITGQALDYLLDVKRMGAKIWGAADHQLSSMIVCDL